MQSQSVGSVEFGKVFHFSVSNRAADGSDAGWDPSVFDVLDPIDGSLVISNQALHKETDRDIWYGTIDTAQSSTELGEALREGTYALMVKPSTSEAPATFAHYNFTITGSYSARLKRLLGLLGENLVIDAFSYDSSGNCTSYRVRLFETRAAADSASAGITDVPEPGEIATYVVEQSYSSGRRLRILHTSLIDEDREEV